jgi:hypothetical protein
MRCREVVERQVELAVRRIAVEERLPVAVGDPDVPVRVDGGRGR